MGMMIVSATVAWISLATPADGHSVAPISSATAKSEVTCDGPLAGAYLSPAETGLGLRASLVPGTVKCKVVNGPKAQDVSVDFTDSDSTIGLAADHPVLLGTDKEATLSTRGEISRADGSAGPAKVGPGTITATLPTIRMPQNLVVLASDSLGNADYAIVPLLGKAKVAVKVKKDAKLEVLVAGHRVTGFTSDKKGKADIAVPAPPGFTEGLLEVHPKKGKVEVSDLNLPAAKPLFALAVLGPSDAVTIGTAFVVLAAGAKPNGLPADESDFSADPSSGLTISQRTLVRPGLWRLDGTAPSADGQVTIKLGQASRVVDIKVKPAPAIAVAEAKPAVAETKPAETKPAETKPAETKPAETKPAVAEIKPADSTPKVTKSAPPPAVADDDGTLRLGIMIEGGYMTNGGAISGLAPGAMVQVAYRMGSFDIGGGLDALVTSTTSHNTVNYNSVALDSTTTTQSLQAMVGPYARYRFLDFMGVAAQAGLGISRVTESITANNQVNSSGASTTIGFAALLGLDFDFGLAQAFVGGRYATANASGTLTGQAGGIAGIVGLGVNLGM